MEEEAAVMTSSPSGMARSPAMHHGFRQEEWIVERTPVNTPDADKVVVGMINLSDEETSNHVDSDVVFKSSTAATSPQEGSIFDSMAELPADDIMMQNVIKPVPVSESAPAKLGSPSIEANVESGVESLEVHEASSEEPVSPLDIHPPNVNPEDDLIQPPLKLPEVEPPMGFADSPSKKAAEADVTSKEMVFPGFHEAVSDQPLPQEEQLLMASEELVPGPRLHITEAFQSEPQVSSEFSSAKMESIEHEHQPLVEATAAISTTTSSAQPPTAASTSCLVQSLERPTKTRKLSSTSTTSRPSTAASKNTTSRSRSRSSSKERLLETLAGSENAPQTSHEEDEIEGTTMKWVFVFWEILSTVPKL